MKFISKIVRQRLNAPSDLAEIYRARSAGEPAFEFLYRSPDLSLVVREGESRSVSVVFVGVGSPGAAGQAPEMIKSASQNGRRRLFYVIDASRRWYTDEGVEPVLLRVFKDYCAAHRIEHVFAVGNSMGGFGAIRFAGALGCDAALALAPQFSVDPALTPRERRWRQYRSRIRKYERATATRFWREDVNYFLVHGLQSEEADQINGFKDLPNGAHALFPGVTHNVGGYLKSRGRLQGLIDSAIAGDWRGMVENCESGGGFVRRAGRWRALEGPSPSGAAG